MNTRSVHPSVSVAIERLDNCIKTIRSFREEMEQDLYVDLISQALLYGQHLTACASFGVPITNTMIRGVGHEIAIFCDFIEKEICYD